MDYDQFEKAVLGAVAVELGNQVPANFTCGTLFVGCDESTSEQLLRVLQKNYTGTLLKSGPIQGEYAYDFV